MEITIDEAIKRYNSNAFYEKSDGNLQGYLEFRQLAEWLKELRAYRNMCHADNIDFAIKTIHKYQKIEEIVKFGNANELGFEYVGEKITEVMEDA